MDRHITVMLHEAVDSLNVTPDGVYVDATLGRGGHTDLLLSRLSESGTLLSLDADPTAIDAYKDEHEVSKKHQLVHANFKELANTLSSHNFHTVDGILADLGWRTEQFTQGGRGFSFNSEEPLYMTYGQPEDYPFTAKDVVNEWAEEDIANVIFAYGEERAARRIAKAIVERRTESPIETASDLAALVAETVKKNPRSRLHPATKTFQALRIVVNDELDVLESFIDQAIAHLRPGGRLAIITFHSLEDRIVKHKFRAYATQGQVALVNKKPMVPSDEEVKENPRARSAKLRVLEKHESTNSTKETTLRDTNLGMHSL